MRRLKSSILVLAWIILHPSPSKAQVVVGEAGRDGNAALQYWQAFTLLPELNKAQEMIIEDSTTAPLDAAAMKLIDASRQSMMYLRRGANSSRCDWGLDLDDGFGLLMPHLAKARNLARFAALHARSELANGNLQAGTEDALAVFTLARHIGATPVMISMLVQYSMETIAAKTLAPWLPKLDGAALAARLDALPPAATMDQALLNEKIHMVGWMIRKMKEAEAAKTIPVQEVWKEFFVSKKEQDLLKSFADYTQAIQTAEGLQPFYARLTTLAALPQAEFKAQYPEFSKQAATANPLAALILPAMDDVLAAVSRHQAQTALLKAGALVAQAGPARLNAVSDPFGAGPFEYRGFDGGFELKSKLLHRGQRVTLTVGSPEKK